MNFPLIAPSHVTCLGQAMSLVIQAAISLKIKLLSVFIF
jgi:hypothetical protein